MLGAIGGTTPTPTIAPPPQPAQTTTQTLPVLAAVEEGLTTTTTAVPMVVAASSSAVGLHQVARQILLDRTITPKVAATATAATAPATTTAVEVGGPASTATTLEDVEGGNKAQEAPLRMRGITAKAKVNKAVEAVQALKAVKAATGQSGTGCWRRCSG